jgi:hypothetical protein
MSNAILFAAVGSDLDALISYIHSIGLILVPDRPGPRSAERLRGGYLSPVPESELQTWRNPRLNYPARYCDVLDPLLEFNLGEVLPNHFRPGRITQNLDNDRLAAETKLNFGRISRWIRKNWPKPEGMYIYSGPEARDLIRSKGLIVTDLVPGVTITYVPIRPNQPIRDHDA